MLTWVTPLRVTQGFRFLVLLQLAGGTMRTSLILQHGVGDQWVIFVTTVANQAMSHKVHEYVRIIQPYFMIAGAMAWVAIAIWALLVARALNAPLGSTAPVVAQIHALTVNQADTVVSPEHISVMYVR